MVMLNFVSNNQPIVLFYIFTFFVYSYFPFFTKPDFDRLNHRSFAFCPAQSPAAPGRGYSGLPPRQSFSPDCSSLKKPSPKP